MTLTLVTEQPNSSAADDTLSHVQHDDDRVAAILRAAQLCADDVHARPVLTQLVVLSVDCVDPGLSADTFVEIYQALEEATDFDTRGAEAVEDHFGGRWSEPGQDADEKASEMRDSRRAAARLMAEMLVTTHNNNRARELAH